MQGQNKSKQRHVIFFFSFTLLSRLSFRVLFCFFFILFFFISDPLVSPFCFLLTRDIWPKTDMPERQVPENRFFFFFKRQALDTDNQRQLLETDFRNRISKIDK